MSSLGDHTKRTDIGAQTLTDLQDVTGANQPGYSPVGDQAGAEFPLTHVVTQADLDDVLAQVVWHRVPELADPWQASNPTARLTPDGVTFGPYPDGAAAGASVRYLGLNGQPFSTVRNLAFSMRYLEDGMHQELSPYLRVFTVDAGGTPHDAIYSPGSQPLYPGLGCGPIQEFVASSGTWRYDSDDGSGGVPLAELQAQYGDHTITKLTVTLGFTGGVNLTGLLRVWQINGNAYLFGGGEHQAAELAAVEFVDEVG